MQCTKLLRPRRLLPTGGTSLPPLIRGLATTLLTSPNRKCIITGASRGIGKAIAQRFAAEGMTCTLVGREQHSLEGVLATLARAPAYASGHGVDGGSDEAPNEGSGAVATPHRIKVGDVANRDFWEALAKEEKDVDVLVNAAGVAHYSLLLATRPSLVEEVVQTNLMGTIWGCQVMMKNMVRRKKGCIINVSSLLAIKGGKGSTVYAASKAGVVGLTRSLAAEIGSTGVRINAILPGYIATQMTEAMSLSSISQALDAIPLGRLGKPEEVADAASFLARNEYANNCILNLDGGLSAM